MVESIPHDSEAEAALIGSVLLKPECLIDLDHVSADTFYTPRHRAAWLAIRLASADGRALDPVTIAGAANPREVSVDDMVGYASATPTAERVLEYARIVCDHAARRQIISLAGLVQVRARSTSDPPDAIASYARESFGSLGRPDDSSESMANDGVSAALQALEDRVRDGDRSAVPTGIRAYDDLISPLTPGRLIVVAARPGVGKSSLALGWARHAAKAGIPAYVLSLEMPSEEVWERHLSAESGLTGASLRRGIVSLDGWRMLNRAGARMADWPMTVCDRVMTAEQAMSRIRAWRNRHTGDRAIVVVDYLQLFRSSGSSESRNLEVGRQAWAMKVLAKDCKCPVVLVGQLTRGSEREEREPRLSDLRDSGEIEAHADVVVFPYRTGEAVDQSGICRLLIKKNRSGRIGTVPVYWRAETMEFLDVADDAGA